jgi:alpha-L-rhamnosidase
VARAVHQKFYNPTEHAYTNGDSVQEAFPLLTGLVPEELRKDVMKKLENTIRVRNGGHLDTGMHGTYFVMKYLIEAGRNDLIDEMTSKQDYPGWGYMLANGATTSWEGWTGQSHIHDTLISIGAWFIEGLGGIQSDGKSPGFQHFVIKPAVVGDLTSARAKYRSIHGEIISDWRIEDGIFKLAVTVPAGTTASVFIPGQAGVEVAPGTHSFETALR